MAQQSAKKAPNSAVETISFSLNEKKKRARMASSVRQTHYPQEKNTLHIEAERQSSVN
jgi:hypothetical protein